MDSNHAKIVGKENIDHAEFIIIRHVKIQDPIVIIVKMQLTTKWQR